MIDAAIAAIGEATGVHGTLGNFQVSSVTGGSDALGAVAITVEAEGRKVTGRGVATDVVEASARAYLNAVNKLVRLRERGEVREMPVESVGRRCASCGEAEHASRSGFQRRSIRTRLVVRTGLRRHVTSSIGEPLVNSEHALAYLREREALPHRVDAYEQVLELLPEFVARVLDLGTGDGLLLELCLAARPQARRRRPRLRRRDAPASPRTVCGRRTYSSRAT